MLSPLPTGVPAAQTQSRSGESLTSWGFVPQQGVGSHHVAGFLVL